MSEKTEKPSAKRLREARKKGDVPRSKPLASAGAALCGLLALAVTAPSAAAQLQGYARVAIAEAGASATPVTVACARAWQMLFALCAPVLAATLLGGLAGAGAQVGVLFNPGAITFKPERLSPVSGVQRIFSKKNLLEVVKALVAIAVILWIAWGTARDSAQLVARLPLGAAVPSWNAVFQIVREAGLKALGFARAFGVLDLLLERHLYMKKLMMSREELKQEHKESEGDPHHKAKRKALHKALLNGTLARGVQKATVVILNPTHISVALRYDPEESAAPTIVAKGADEEAAKIRWLARQLRVPMVRDVPLARALFPYELGEEIPEELYQAAACVLRQVHEMGAELPVAPRSKP